MAPRNHDPGDRLKAEKHALRVHPMHAVPIGLGDVHDIRAPCHAGVVDENIDAAKGGDRGIDHALDVGSPADVAGYRHGAAPLTRQGVRRPLGKRAVDVDRDDDGPGLGKCRGGGRTDAATCTGHHRHAILEHHDTSPP